MQTAKNTNPLQPVLTVSQLTAQVRELVETAFDQVAVVGEVSNSKIYTSGHWYFSLKDKDATLSCVCFKSANSAIKFRLDDGLMVVARGHLSVYPPKGGYQLVATALEPVGVGEWQLAFEQLKSKLQAEGLFDPARKRPIPTLPRRIGVVTSPVGAAVRDVISALRRRNKGVSVVIAPAKVQGEGSADEIAQAIEFLNRVPSIDVIIVARGGGSIEDLWSFNTETVARAIASSAIPIISGVGHETDITISDLVADLRAPTPTAAAELVAKGSAEILEKWGYLKKQLLLRMQTLLQAARRRFERSNPIHSIRRYDERLKRGRLRISNGQQQLLRLTQHCLARHDHKWRQKHEKLLALNPTSVLGRGFAIVRTRNGSVVRSPEDVQIGDQVEALLQSGTLGLRVQYAQRNGSPLETFVPLDEVIPIGGTSQNLLAPPHGQIEQPVTKNCSEPPLQSHLTETTINDRSDLLEDLGLGEVDAGMLLRYCAQHLGGNAELVLTEDLIASPKISLNSDEVVSDVTAEVDTPPYSVYPSSQSSTTSHIFNNNSRADQTLESSGKPAYLPTDRSHDNSPDCVPPPRPVSSNHNQTTVKDNLFTSVAAAPAKSKARKRSPRMISTQGCGDLPVQLTLDIIK